MTSRSTPIRGGYLSRTSRTRVSLIHDRKGDRSLVVIEKEQNVPSPCHYKFAISAHWSRRKSIKGLGAAWGRAKRECLIASHSQSQPRSQNIRHSRAPIPPNDETSDEHVGDVEMRAVSPERCPELDAKEMEHESTDCVEVANDRSANCINLLTYIWFNACMCVTISLLSDTVTPFQCKFY